MRRTKRLQAAQAPRRATRTLRGGLRPLAQRLSPRQAARRDQKAWRRVHEDRYEAAPLFRPETFMSSLLPDWTHNATTRCVSPRGHLRRDGNGRIWHLAGGGRRLGGTGQFVAVRAR